VRKYGRHKKRNLRRVELDMLHCFFGISRAALGL